MEQLRPKDLSSVEVFDPKSKKKHRF